MERALANSVHHQRVGDTRWVMVIDGADPSAPGAIPSEFDTDSLFATTLQLALDGLEAALVS